MSDVFRNHDAVTAPARRLLAVTPNDNSDLPEIPKALFVGGAGTLSVIAVDDATAVTLTVVSGQLLPVRVRRVRFSGTTATSIVALY